MQFKPSNYIHTLKDEFDEFYFNQEELYTLKKHGIQAIYQIFQDPASKPDPQARYVRQLLSNIQIGENSREWRIEDLRKNCDEEPSGYAPRVHTATISYNKIASTWHPHADGYLPRRARGELSQTATDHSDTSRATRELFDNHHRGSGYDHDDFGSCKFN